MAVLQSQVQAISRQAGGTPVNPGGTFGEALFTELSPQYYTLIKQGKVFTVTAAAANPTAFTGGAAGTPLLGIYNPTTSGVDIVLLQARVGIRTTGTAAVSYDFAFWGAQQGTTSPSGTQSLATNMYSLKTGGSVSYCMANVANTGAAATSLIAPSFSGGLTAATAITNVANLVDDIKGAIVIAPGGYLAYGATGSLTAASLDVGLIWAELPV